MGCAKCFVQVYVDQVEPDVSRAALAKDCVEVGAVAINQSVYLMDHLCYGRHSGIVEAQRARGGQHRTSHVFVHEFFEFGQINVAVFVRRDCNHGESADGGRCGRNKRICRERAS